MKSLLLSVSWFSVIDFVAAAVHIVEKLSKFLLGGARLNGMMIGRMKRSVVVRKSTSGYNANCTEFANEDFC